MEAKLEDRVNSCTEEIKPILKKYNLKMGAIPAFPQYAILPDEVQLALKILDKNGVQYHVAFQEEKNNAN